jgi:hypothetical protein
MKNKLILNFNLYLKRNKVSTLPAGGGWCRCVTMLLLEKASLTMVMVVFRVGEGQDLGPNCLLRLVPGGGQCGDGGQLLAQLLLFRRRQALERCGLTVSGGIIYGYLGYYASISIFLYFNGSIFQKTVIQYYGNGASGKYLFKKYGTSILW